jgi:predicted dehydrogenase
MQRVLIVGHGSIGQRHLRIVRESLPDAMIMVFRHKPTTDIPEMANLVTSSIDDVRSFAPEAAIVANPAPFHLKIAKSLAEMGCHLLIEKPISDKIDGVVELLESIRTAGVICQVGYNLRSMPSLSRLRDLIKDRLVGQPLSVRCEVGQYLPNWRPDTDYRTGVSARRDLGGGVLLELSHEIDYLRWIFGEVSWSKGYVSKVSSLEVDVEDIAYLLFGMRKTGFSQSTTVSLNMDFFRHDPVRICTVIGEDGTLSWNGYADVIKSYEPTIGWKEIYKGPSERDQNYKNQWNDFMNSIHNYLEPLVTLDDGLEVLKIIDMIRGFDNEYFSSSQIEFKNEVQH